MKYRIIFASTDSLTLPILESLVLHDNCELVQILTKSGSVFEDWAIKHRASVSTPTFLKENLELFDQLRSLKPDFLIVVSYGFLIPSEMLEIPKLGAINLHPSLLPKYRGSSPAQWAIQRGEKISGMSVMTMSPEFDKGDLIFQWEISIEDNETARSYYQKAFTQTAEKLPKILNDFADGKLKPIPQETKKGLFLARKLTKEDGKIDWNDPIEQIERQIRAFYPWPGAWTRLSELKEFLTSPTPNGAINDQKTVKIIEAHLENGRLVIEKLQVEGKKPISYAEF